MKIKKVHGFVVPRRVEYATVRNIKKISTFLQNDRPKPVGVSARSEMDLNVPEPEPGEDLVAPAEHELDVVDLVELYTPGPSTPEPDPEEDLVDSVELYVPCPSISEPHPEWVLAAPEESCAPGPSVPEPESKVTSELSTLENYIPQNVFQLEDCLKKCALLKERHVTNVWPRKALNYYLGTYYRGLHINYYGLPTTDRHSSDISKYFMPAAKLIDKALDKRVRCCKQGVEHSATLFLAYLMICHDMMVEEAIDHVIKSRRITPSRDFLKKLTLLNADLVNKRKLKLQDTKTGRKRKKWQLKKSRA
uniref:Tyrosine-protein phosphatase domain-containing protein n=1 Tax=Sinocyclocheilus anshuiensis TaxID=1608454 RepID=A0A671LBK7_9TELE